MLTPTEYRIAAQRQLEDFMVRGTRPRMWESRGLFMCLSSSGDDPQMGGVSTVSSRDAYRLWLKNLREKAHE